MWIFLRVSWFLLLRIPLSKNSKLINSRCKHQFPFLCLGYYQGCCNLSIQEAAGKLAPSQPHCWRRACSDKLLLSFLQQLKSLVSSRVKARQCAGRGLVELVKSPSAGLRLVLRNHGPVKKEVHTLIPFWAIFHHSDEQIQVQRKKEMTKWKVNEMKEQWFL